MVTNETWAKAAGLEPALDKLRKKAVLCAEAERAGKEDLFNKLLREKHLLGIEVSECQSAKDQLLATVPIEIRQAQNRAEVAVRVAASNLAKAKRAYDAQEGTVSDLVKRTAGQASYAHDIARAKESLSVRSAEVEVAAKALKSAEEVLVEATAKAQPKRETV